MSIPEPAAARPYVPQAGPEEAPVVTVQVPGRDTVTFPAIRDDAPEKCKCGTAGCPDADPENAIPGPTDPRLVLSCGPGTVSAVWRERVRNGTWMDIEAEADAGAERIHKPAGKCVRKIHNNLDCDWHQIAAVFRTNTALLTDPLLGQHLREMESVLAGRLEEDRRRSEERWGRQAA